MLCGLDPQLALRSATARSPDFELRRVIGKPNGGGAQYARPIGKPQTRDMIAQITIVAIGRIHQNNGGCYSCLNGCRKLPGRNLRLGLEHNIARNAGLLAQMLILYPCLWKIKTIGNRQAGLLVQTDRLTATWQLSRLPL